MVHTLLLGRCHLGVVLRDIEPFHPSRRFYVGPVLRERCQDFLMFGIKLRPLDRANVSRSFAGHGPRWETEQQQACEDYSVD